VLEKACPPGGNLTRGYLVTLLLNNYNYDVGYYDSSTSTMYFKHFSIIYASNYDEVRNDD